MKLSITERLACIDLLKAESGSYLTLKLIREFREECSFSQKELIDFEMTGSNSGWSWNPSKAKVKEIKLEDVIKNKLIENLKALDKQEKLIEMHMSLFDKLDINKDINKENEKKKE